jgi:prepilin-type N-terminal cleavage/methylation domain-containing protein
MKKALLEVIEAPCRCTHLDRRAFTLIELLVVISIFVTLIVITASMVRLSLDGDKVRNGARQIQSFLMGARDRAIYAKTPVGVRFIKEKDPINDRIVRSMTYIQPGELWSDGLIELGRDGAGNVTLVNEKFGTNWQNLIDRNQFPTDIRIRIPKGGGGRWYRATQLSPTQLRLSTPFQIPAETAASNPVAFSENRSGVSTYDLQLDPAPIPGQKPVTLPSDVVINLDRSSRALDNLNTPGNRGSTLPDIWRNTSVTPPKYRDNLDIMFSPSGTVVGDLAATGLLHLYVGTKKAADLDQLAWQAGATADAEDAESRGDKLIVSVATRTGATSTHPISSLTNDRLLYAETGEGASK